MKKNPVFFKTKASFNKMESDGFNIAVAVFDW